MPRVEYARHALRSHGIAHVLIRLETTRHVEFIDLTPMIVGAIQDYGLVDGLVTIQTRHTTMGLLVNEHEPLLLDDLNAMFERLAPADLRYAHDDVTRRTVNLTPGERRNGHAHCRAALLRTSESLCVAGGALVLGRWQRVLAVEFDGGQARQLWLTLLGEMVSDRGGAFQQTPPALSA